MAEEKTDNTQTLEDVKAITDIPVVETETPKADDQVPQFDQNETQLIPPESAVINTGTTKVIAAATSEEVSKEDGTLTKSQVTVKKTPAGQPDTVSLSKTEVKEVPASQVTVKKTLIQKYAISIRKSLPVSAAGSQVYSLTADGRFAFNWAVIAVLGVGLLVGLIDTTLDHIAEYGWTYLK